MHHIKEIYLENIIIHEKSKIELPECGIVLITGINGSGKSSFIEGVVNTFWGKTLRSTPAWINDKACLSRVKTYSGLDVVRKKNKNKLVQLEFNDSNHGTATKAQDDLDPIVGDFYTWCKTSVFSSKNVSVFAEATDKQRKELIEGLLGFGNNFNNALYQCRKDITKTKENLWGFERGLDVTRERVKSSKKQLGLLQESFSHKVKPNKDNIKELKDNIESLELIIKDTQHTLSDERKELVEFKSVLSSNTKKCGYVEAEYNNVLNIINKLGDECPTCEQKISEKTKVKLTSKLNKANKKLKETTKYTKRLRKSIEFDIHDTENVITKLNKEIHELELKKNTLEQKLQEAKKSISEYNHVKKETEKIKTELDENKVKEKEFIENIEFTKNRIELLSEVETVLGTEGFRAHILGKALGGIEALTNNWLSKIARPGVYIELKPYAELKQGGVRDRISLIIHGIGGGHGYKAASTGEQRRVDIAILFALADFEAGAKSVEPGTLFIDEALDGLDESGRVAVADVLHELSETRCIVIISHDESLAQTIKTVRHYKVSEGRIL